MAEHKRINNIETLRVKYRKNSILNGRTAEERKAILYAWRDSFTGPERERFELQLRMLILLKDGFGELSALEYLFRLVEFVAYVDEFAISKPNKTECGK